MLVPNAHFVPPCFDTSKLFALYHTVSVLCEMGGGLSKPVESVCLHRHTGAHFDVGVAEMNGWRPSMEDAHVVHLRPDWGWFGVLDGHGGAACSVWCAKRLMEILQEEGAPADDLAVKQLVLRVDEEYLRTGVPSGSTAAMCVIRNAIEGAAQHTLDVINVGDSRVLLGRRDGTIVDGGGSNGRTSTRAGLEWA